jgi:hypothetical protein
MDELSIVIGLIVLITIFIMYNQQNSTKQCDEYVTYFDKMYYDLPKLNTVNQQHINQESMHDMNSIKQQARKVRNVGDYNNLMASRWASQHDLHGKNSNGSISFTNTDRQVVPTDLQHQLKKSSNKVLKRTDRFNSRVDGFADDE